MGDFLLELRRGRSDWWARRGEVECSASSVLASNSARCSVSLAGMRVTEQLSEQLPCRRFRMGMGNRRHTVLMNSIR